MIGYFHTDSARDMEWLENVLRTAREQDRSIRLDVQNGRLKVKSGGGGWTAPISGTPDAFRDSPLDWEPEPLQEVQPVRLFPNAVAVEGDDGNVTLVPIR